MNAVKITAPWTPDQVAALNRYQDSGWHPFTCGNPPCGGASGGTSLVAHMSGWECPGCGYSQNWAWDYMAADIPGPRKVIEDESLRAHRQAIDELDAESNE